MPPSLRKACHACAQSKRRCVPHLPSCDRCAKKQIPCCYDLEPVSQGEIPPQLQQNAARDRTGNGDDRAADQDFKIVYDSVKSAREASVIAMAEGHTSQSVATHPKMVGAPQLTAWVLNFFSNVVRDAQMGIGTPFVHNHILQTEFDKEELTVKIEYFRRMAQIHKLTMQSLTMLLNKSSNKSDLELENLVVQMFLAARELWSSPPRRFDDSFTPWETWLLAESIRRSIFAATIVKGILSFVRIGYVTYEPFFESCPFDPRAGLWEASNEEGWEATLKGHGGDHVKLKSYHEFVTGASMGATAVADSSPQIKLNPDEDGAFQRLLFTCYHFDAGKKCPSEANDQNR